MKEFIIEIGRDAHVRVRAKVLAESEAEVQALVGRHGYLPARRDTGGRVHRRRRVGEE